MRIYGWLMFSVTFIFMGSAAHGAAYKWVDEKGGMHYSQNRPEGVANFEIISTGESYPSAEKEKDKTKPVRPPKSSAAPNPPDTSSALGMADEERCKKLKDDVARVRILPRIRVKQGESLKILTEEEKDAYIDERVQWLEKYCP